MSALPTRMRFWLPVSLAIRVWPSAASSTEFLAERNSALFSNEGRSLATAIIIPKTVDTQASTARPNRMKASRSFFTFGRGASGGPPLAAISEPSAAAGGRRSVGVGGSFIVGTPRTEGKSARVEHGGGGIRPVRRKALARGSDGGGSLALSR